jgi:hypothetical protein
MRSFAVLLFSDSCQGDSDRWYMELTYGEIIRRLQVSWIYATYDIEM